MRSIMFAALLGLAGSLAGCCDPGPGSTHTPDLSVDPLAACPSGAEQLRGATCSYGKDTQCRSPFGYACQCLCTGYWECDQVKVVCDPDGGVPHD